MKIRLYLASAKNFRPTCCRTRSHSHIHSRLIHGIGADHYVGCKRHLIEPEERVEAGTDAYARLREVLVHVVIAAATRYVNVHELLGTRCTMDLCK